MTRVADSQARQRALEPGQSFIVQAPAGSGKTELLVWRFLKLLAIANQPEEIVALTFTRKAAAEMRHRILDAIENSAQISQDDERTRTLVKLATAAEKRDQEQGWNLTKNPSRLRIQTLDSFASMLVQRMPWSASFGAMPSTHEDAQPLYREAAQTTLQHLESTDTHHAEAITTLLRHVDGDTRRLTDLLVAMLNKRDQWLRYIGGGEATEAWRQALEKSWAGIIESELVHLKKHFPVELENDLIECASFAAANLLESEKTSPITHLISLTEIPDSTVKDLSQWQALAELLLTKDKFRERINKHQGFPATKETKLIKERMQSLLQALVNHEAFRGKLAGIRGLPMATYQRQQWDVLQALLVVLRLAVAELYLVFRREACIDFIELNQRANQALGSADAPTDLALYFDTLIRHLLVDEFQDTSYSQLELLQTLTGGWQPDDGRSLFLVGDPMQSIYRFREAEVGIFLSVQRNGLGSLQLESLQLETNFRSDAALVEWVNQVFPNVLPNREDIATGAVPFAAATPKKNFADPNIQWHTLLESNERQACYLADVVQREYAEYPQQTIAVLVRNRNHVAGLSELLQQRQIPVTMVEMQHLSQQPVINDMFSLARALMHPADRLAWLAILRAPWCGLTLNDLTLLVDKNRHATVWQCIEQSEILKKLSKDGQIRLRRIQPILARALTNATHLSLVQRVESVWLQLGGPACVGSNALNDAQTFLQLLNEYTQNQIIDLPNLYLALENRRASSIAAIENAVQIMTIHKAKGLEFDSVILPSLERGPRLNEKTLLEWAELPINGKEALLFAPLEETGSDSEPKYNFLRQWNRMRNKLETGRLLYVACTRARRRLHLLGNVMTNKSGEIKLGDDTFLKLLWPVACEIFTSSAPLPIRNHSEHDNDKTFPSLKRLPPHWQLFNLPSDLEIKNTQISPITTTDNVEYRWAGDIARQIGLVIHDLLKQSAQDQSAIDQKHHWRAMLQEAGVPVNRLDEALHEVERAVENILTDERARWILDPSHTMIQNEWGLTGLADGTRVRAVIDRTFVDKKGTRWIIDYKTGSHEGGDINAFLDREMERYRPQLERYARIMHNIDTRPIQLGLYFPLLRGWREWEFISNGENNLS